MLSLNDSVPVRDPRAVGVKITETVQYPPTATTDPQVDTNPLEKSPDAPIEVIEIGTEPVFVKVTGCEALGVLMACPVNDSIPGTTVAVGATAVICTVLGVLELKPLLTIN